MYAHERFPDMNSNMITCNIGNSLLFGDELATLAEYKHVSQLWIQFRPHFCALKKFKSSSNRGNFKM
jgi:hypothetical protein